MRVFTKVYFPLCILFLLGAALGVVLHAQQILPTREGAAMIVNDTGYLKFSVDASGNGTITPSSGALSIVGTVVPTIATGTGAAVLSSGQTLTNTTIITGATIGATNINATGGFSVGGGTAAVALLTASATLDFPSINAFSTTNLTITIAGAGTNSVVFLGLPPAFEGGLGANGYVSSTNTVSVRVSNPTAAAINPASQAFRATVINY